MKRIIVFSVACLTILLFAVPSYPIVYVSGDFTTDKWVEEFKGGGPGQPGNTLKAKGHGFDFKKAVLDNTVPTGAVDEYMTTYTGGELKLKAKGPWVDEGELKDTDITATNVSTFNNATGQLIFTLTFCGEFDNAPGVWYAVKATYDGYPGFKLKGGVLKSQTGYSPGFEAIIVIEEGGACPLIGTSGELICDGTNTTLIQPCTEPGPFGNVCEGEQECRVDGWGPCNLPDEICDGVDNNCDGVIDEGFGYQDYNGATYPGEACGTGACSGGVVECSADGSGAVCSTDESRSPEICDDGIDNDCDGETDEGEDCNLPIPANAGDLIITEIMFNPSAFIDPEGEYFELYNTTTEDLRLDGSCSISDDGINFHTINNSIAISAGSYAIFSESDNALGGPSPSYVYGNFILNNSGDAIIITCNGTEIDRVAYIGAQSGPGTSLSLDPSTYDSIQNNDSANWCPSTSSFGTGDLGTPFTVSAQCLPTVPVDDTPCDLGACITGETYFDGICQGGSSVDCSDLNAICERYTCDPSGGEGNCSIPNTPDTEPDCVGDLGCKAFGQCW